MGSNHSIHVVRDSLTTLLKKIHISDKDAYDRFRAEKEVIIFNDGPDGDGYADEIKNIGTYFVLLV